MNYLKERDRWDIHDLVDIVVQGAICRKDCCKGLVEEYDVVREPIRPNSKDRVRIKLKYLRKHGPTFTKDESGHWIDDDTGEPEDPCTA